MSQYLDQTGLDHYTAKMMAAVKGMISEALTDLDVTVAVTEALEDVDLSEITVDLSGYYTADETDEKIDEAVEEVKEWVGEEFVAVTGTELEAMFN